MYRKGDSSCLDKIRTSLDLNPVKDQTGLAKIMHQWTLSVKSKLQDAGLLLGLSLTKYTTAPNWPV